MRKYYNLPVHIWKMLYTHNKQVIQILYENKYGRMIPKKNIIVFMQVDCMYSTHVTYIV